MIETKCSTIAESCVATNGGQIRIAYTARNDDVIHNRRKGGKFEVVLRDRKTMQEK